MEAWEVAWTVVEVKDAVNRACEDRGERGGSKTRGIHHRDMETRGSVWTHGLFAHLMKT